jgi:hypothetical protein
MDWQNVGESEETVLGNLGNVRRIRIIIAMCSIDLASQCCITDELKETILVLIILVFIFVYAQLNINLWS